MRGICDVSFYMLLCCWCVQCQFLIVACDGVWDVMSDQEAIDVVRCGCRVVVRILPNLTVVLCLYYARVCYRRMLACALVLPPSQQVRENVPTSGVIPASAATRAAQLVVDAAIARGSTDNVTCIVVFF